jgi:hypothetical protein
MCTATTGGLDQLLAASDRLTVYCLSFPPVSRRASQSVSNQEAADNRASAPLAKSALPSSSIRRYRDSRADSCLWVVRTIISVRQAKTMGLYLVGDSSADYGVASSDVIAELKRLGVQVAPSLTGDRAIEQFPMSSARVHSSWRRCLHMGRGISEAVESRQFFWVHW